MTTAKKSTDFSTRSATTWPELHRLLGPARRILISTHVNPDGDCLGSELAMAWYLRSIGKNVVVYNADPVPSKFLFFSDAGIITTQRPVGPFDLLMILDASNPDRLSWENPTGMAPASINIDHHRDNTRFGAFNFVDSSAAATGEIIYRFFEENDIDFPPHVAEALYTAILTDTGCFGFSNTDAVVLHVCARLVERGVDPATVYRTVFASYSPEGLKLRSEIWSSLKFFFDNKVCSLEYTLDRIEALNANYGDAEGMADITVTANTVQVGMFIKHGNQQTHFSLRSKGIVDVGALARNIPGGGGHACAAGCTLPFPLEESRKRMMEIVARNLV